MLPCGPMRYTIGNSIESLWQIQEYSSIEIPLLHVTKNVIGKTCESSNRRVFWSKTQVVSVQVRRYNLKIPVTIN